LSTLFTGAPRPAYPLCSMSFLRASLVLVPCAVAALFAACSSEEPTGGNAGRPSTGTTATTSTTAAASSSTSSTTGSSGIAGGGGGGAMGCVPGTTQPCYDGPNDTMNVGVCKPGMQTCLADGSAYGACGGEVVPSAEDCATPVDDDCNGMVNEA